MKRHGSMNHIYRLIWSHVLNGWVAVAETSRGRGKGARRKLVAAALALNAIQALAAPDGGQMVSGSGSITQSGATTTINQTSQNLSLNWRSFNVGANESVNFVQPSAAAIAVNRIFDTNASQILGRINANGQVYLINPNGILFGRGAQVNVGGLVASTLEFNDATLNSNTRTFSGNGSGSILNQGTINAANGGYVALLGNHVGNQGTITAPQGAVALGAGNVATLTFQSNSLVKMQVDQSVLNSLAENGGLIRADGGMVVMTAGAKDALLASVVNNTGVIEARAVENHNGSIILLGGMAAGTVNVGGTLDASAGYGGNGGFIETSAAHVKVADNARITTAASMGLSGTWLIDPVDFTIAASGGDMSGATLATNLGSGNVTIQSTSGGTGTAGDVNVNDAVSWSANKLTLNAQNNININANLNASATASLALEFGQGAVAAGNTSNVITTAASVNLPAGTSNFTTRQGSDGAVKNYTVITSLGAAGSTTTTDLQGMNGNLALNYALGANIDASATLGWEAGAGFMPIGGTNCWACTSISGTIDGLGHTVSGLTVNRPSRSMIGLFGYGTATSVIRNIGLSGGSFSGASYTGTLIGRSGGTVFNSYSTANVTGTGYVGGLVGRNYGTISNSYATGNVVGSRVGGLVGRNDNGTVVSNSYATGSVTGSQYAGGLVGDSDNTAISNSYATGNVTGGDRHAGGLVGRMSSGSISNSYATGNVSGVGWTGGLVGDADSVTISNSHATGSVTSTDQRTGGLLGHAYGITLSNSYATGAVSGTNYTGGLTGYMYGGSATNTYATGAVSGTSNVGGLVGYMTYGSVVRSYSTGAVSGSSALGGLVGGGNYGPSVSNSYWNTDTSGQASSSGGTGRTSVQMQTASNFTGFTFTTTAGAAGNNWVMVDADGTLNNAGGALGATRPMLASEYSTAIANGHQLQLMRMNLAGNYTLTKNIDLTAELASPSGIWGSSVGFAYIGTIGTQFTGTFDGLGHTITGVTINQPSLSYVGLFGVTGPGSTISNVGLLNGSVTGASYIGGLVGRNGGAINNSYTTIGVTGTSYVGGIAGYIIAGGTVDNSYAAGAVAATRAGGLVGRNEGTISNSYATGAATGSFAGGLLGLNQATVTNSFWDTQTSGLTTSSGGIGMTTAQMQTQANFTSATAANGSVNPAWDMSNTWVMYDGYTSPLLRSFMTALTVTATGAGKTYDGLAYSGGNGVTYSSTPNGNLLGTVSYSGTSQGATNAGSYVISAGGLYSTQQGYAINFVDGALTVNKANLTLGGTRAYDGTSAVAGSVLTATGVAGETFAVTGAGDSSNLASKNIQTNSTLANLTGLALGASGNGGLSGNYNTLSTTGSAVSITTANLTLATSNVTKTYDGGLTAAGTATVTSGTLFGSDSISGGTFAFTDKNAGAGNKTVSTTGVTVTDGNSGANYNVSYANNTTSTINQANLTLGGTRTYDGTSVIAGSVLTATGVAGETFAVTGAGDSSNLASKNIQTNSTLANLTGLALGASGNGGLSGNYNALSTTGSAVSITTANLTLATSNVTKTYDGGLTAAGTATVTSGTLFGSDSISGGTFAFTDKNAGAGNKTVSTSGVTVTDGNSGGNYNVSYANNTASTISQANLALGGTRVYDGTSVIAGSVLTATGVAGETFAVTGAGDSSNLASKNVQTNSTLVNLTGLALGASGNGGLSGNYNALSTTGSAVSITTANLTLSTSDVTKTYDGALSASGTATVTSGTLFGSDAISGGTFAFTNANAATGSKTVSTAGVTVTDGNSGSNYNVSYANNTTSTINKANLTLSTSDVSKGYDGTLAAIGTATVTSGTLYNNASNGGALDSISGGSFVYTNANAGSGNKTVSTAGVTVADGNSGGNYNVTYANNTASTISQANLTLSTSNVSKTYDGGLSAAGTATVTGGSLFGSDSISGGTFAFTNANAGSGNKSVSTSGVTVADGNSGGNYNVSYANNTTSTINKANLTLSTSNVSKTYDGTLAAIGTATVTSGTLYNNASNSGTLDSISGGTFAFTNANAATGSKTVSTAGVTVTDGNSGGNYNVSYADNTTSTIAKADLTISTSNASKVYDAGLTAAGTAVLTSGTLYSNASNGNTQDSISGGTFAYTDKNVGSGTKAVTSAGVTVSDGNGGGNYNVTYANNTTSTITAANLAVTGVTANSKAFDGTTAATLTGTATATALGADVVTVGGSGIGAFADSSIGSGKAVSVSGYTLAGTDAGNYTIVQPAGLMADIIAAAAPAPVLNVTTALASTVVSPPASTQLEAANLSSTMTATSVSSADVAAPGGSAGSGNAAVVNNVTMNIGGMGSTLKIVNGGVKLPDHLVNGNE